MATNSFLKSIKVRDKKSIEALVNALETAQGKHSNEVVLDRKVRIASKKDITKIFGFSR